MGLKYFKRYRMEARPAVIAAHAAPLPAGYRFVPWPLEASNAEVKAILNRHAEAKHESFRGELDATVFDCLDDYHGCHDLLTRISNCKGFQPSATWLIEYVAGPRKIEPCGTIQGTLAAPRVGAIHNVGVTPLHRGRGLGRALVAMAMQGFLQVGVSKVYLQVTAENDAAVRMYHRLGFRRKRTLYRGVDLPMTVDHQQEAFASH